MKTRDAGSIGDKATVKKRNGTGIDESNVVISIYFLFYFAKISYFIMRTKDCIFKEVIIMYRNFINYLVDLYFSNNYGFDCRDGMNLEQFFIYMGQKNEVYNMYDNRIKMIGMAILLVIVIIIAIRELIKIEKGE